MAGKNTSVFGIFPDQLTVENAVDALKAAGYRSTDISVLFPENKGTKDFALEKQTKAPEGAVTGASSGAVIGGALGWLAGIGALAIPGLGPFIAAGPIVAMLSGVGVGGAIGGITGALVGLGIPEYEAKRYEGRIRKGGILLSVHCDNSEWVKKAKEILHHHGAEDVASASEARADFAVSSKPEPRSREEGFFRNDGRTVSERVSDLVDRDNVPHHLEGTHPASTTTPTSDPVVKRDRWDADDLATPREGTHPASDPNVKRDRWDH